MKHRIALAFFIIASTVASIVMFGETSSATLPLWRGGGDLSDASTMVSQTVVGIKGKPVPTLAVGALSYDGGSWYFGSSGGSVSPGAAGQALWTNDAGAATVWAYPHGDVDASASDPGALTVNAIQGFGVSASVPSSTNVLAYSSGLWRPTALTTSNITPGTAGQVMVSNATPSAAWTSLISYETTHGRFTAGNGGSDTFTSMGPYPGGETTYAAFYALSHGATPGSSNYLFLSNGTDAYFNTPSAGTMYFANNGNVEASLTTSSLSLVPPAIQWGGGVSAATLGTNKAAATMKLQTDAATTWLTGHVNGNSMETTFADKTGTTIDTLDVNPTAGVIQHTTSGSYEYIWTPGTGEMVVASTLFLVGGAVWWLAASNSGVAFNQSSYTSAAPLRIDYSTPTTPYVQSGTSATSLTIGTNKSGATLALQGDAASTVQTISANGTDFSATTTPGVPASNTQRVYTDSADGKLKAQDHAGNIFVLAP